METPRMPSLTSREDARARLQSLFQQALDRFIPSNEQVALRGKTFAEFEEQTYRHGNEVLAAMMEERAKLDEEAVVTTAGRCPYCESDRTYLCADVQHKEIRSPSGGVSVQVQQVRCRA